MIEIRRVENAEDIAKTAAAIATETLAGAVQKYGEAVFVLAGGRLPPVAYGILASEHADALDWHRVKFLIGDERCVPLDSEDSSWLGAVPMLRAFGMAESNMLRPESNLPPSEAAERYDQVLSGLAKNDSGLPRLSHVWLGMGEDGHTLSIFPDHPSAGQGTGELVMPVYDSPKPPPGRITLTYRALQGAESVVALISGEGKAEVLARIANGDHSLPIVKASHAAADSGGKVIWLVDDAAASLLDPAKELRL